MKDTNIFTESLRYAFENIRPFSYVEFVSHLEKKGLLREGQKPDSWQPELEKIYCYIVGWTHFTSFNSDARRPGSPTGDALSKYVELVELQESRNASIDANVNAQKANKHAMKAIRIAVWP